jgi:hypothetical protein
MVGAVNGVVGAVDPSSTQPAVAAEEEVPASSQPAMVPQERDALEGTTRAASPEIKEAVTPESLNSPVSRGRPPSRSAMLSRMTRRSRRATLSSAGWRGRAMHSTS